jgi:exopolysaccharide biosynthesis polyprenyl glycosylphosphotransferase
MTKPLSSSTRKKLLVFVDFGLVVIAVMAAAVVKSGPVLPSSLTTVSRILMISLVLQLSFYYNNLYDLKATHNFIQLAYNLIHSFAVGALILGITYLALPGLMIGRGVFFLCIVFVILLVFPWRFFYVWMLKRKGIAENLLIVGANGVATEIAKEVLERPQSGYHLVGFYTDNDNPPVLPKKVPVVSSSEENLFKWMADKDVNTLVVTSQGAERKGLKSFLNRVKEECPAIEVRRGSDFYEEVAGKVLLSSLTIADVPQVKNVGRTKFPWHLKRLIDILISLVGLILSVPISLLTAIAIKITSRGPVLFAQERVGQNGHPFKLLKFRSMRENAEEESGPVWANVDDPRITPVGRIIRKFRIDEIPQMVNVLTGRMSFIGPRPERPVFVNEFETKIPFYCHRHSVKPGITGLAQVRHYYTASTEETVGKLEYDLYYIKHMSPLFDFMILLDTIKTIMFGSGAR